MSQEIVLVTGGAGHVGSHLVERLAADPNKRVISLDNYFVGRTKNHVKGVEYRDGHTRDIDRLVPETPAIVYHLGEYARIAPSFEDIAQVFEMNIVGTFAVIEFCRKRNVSKLVYAGSSTRFAIEGDGRHQNPYSFTKATNVDLVNDYGRWFNLPYAVCYLSNGFGPRENRDGNYSTVVARFEAMYLEGKPLTVTKPGTQRRAFTYVTDLARGIEMVGEKGHGDGYILCAERKHTVLEVAEAFGGPIEMVDGYPGRADADINTEKANSIGWSATVDVIDYIKEFVAKHPRRR